MRSPVTKPVETQVLTTSQRKCCLCYYLATNRTQRKGQIAHLNKDSSNSEFENLVWLCLEHHDDFDSKTSQSKGYTSEEVRTYRDRLYKELGTKNVNPNDGIQPSSPPKPIEQFSPELRKVIEDSKGELDYLLTPWRLVAWPDVRSFFFAYKASNCCDGICRVERLFLKDGRVAVICKQILHSPGQGVTNSIEEIAFQVCAKFEIESAKLVLIDYYPFKGSLWKNRWNLVSFQSCPPNGMFKNPSWKVMTSEDWRALGLRPRGKIT